MEDDLVQTLDNILNAIGIQNKTIVALREELVRQRDEVSLLKERAERDAFAIAGLMVAVIALGAALVPW